MAPVRVQRTRQPLIRGRTEGRKKEAIEPWVAEAAQRLAVTCDRARACFRWFAAAPIFVPSSLHASFGHHLAMHERVQLSSSSQDLNASAGLSNAIAQSN